MLWIISTVSRISLKRWRRFSATFALIMIISMLIPIIAAMHFYRTGLARVVPILGDAWYLRISVGEPTEFTRIIERIIPFYRYPIFAVEFQDPFAPKIFYTYENLITTAIIAIIGSLLVCLYSEYVSVKGPGLVAIGSMRRKGGSLTQAGALFPALIQGGSVAYTGIIGCSTCYGSLLVQVTLAGLTITITSTLAAYISSINFMITMIIGLVLIVHMSRKIKRLGSYSLRYRR